MTQISLQERERLMATSSYVVDVVVPRSSVVDGDPQVFHRINFVKFVPFHGITEVYDASLLCH